MADPTIFGIDGNIVQIYAEIGVSICTLILALATIYLAKYTSKSVQTSRDTLESLKTQVKIAKDEFENKQAQLDKPQIIDQLHHVLNPLRSNIIPEIRQLNENLFFWKFLRFRESSRTPIKRVDQFYDNPDPSTSLGLIIYNIDSQNSNFSKMCHDRHNLFLKIRDVVNEVYVEIKKQRFDEKIDLLIKNRDDYIRQPDGLNRFNEQTYNEFVQLFYFDEDLPVSCAISFDTFKSTIIDVGVAKFFSQRPDTDDSSSIIIQEFSDYEDEFKTFFSSEKFKEIEKKFQSQLNELKEIDDTLLKNIDEIRLFRRQKYHLDQDECWKTKYDLKNE